MSQTYTPGTILSVGFGPTLEQVVVLSDNKVATKTYAGQPVAHRDIMSLEDWRTLARSTGQEIQIDYLPLVSSATPTVATSVTVAAAPPQAQPQPQPQPEPEKVYPVGTMLRWKKDPENRRCAIILKDGILQVKEVIMGRFTFDALGRCKQMFFSSLADWKSTLPADGTLTASEVTEDQTIPSIKRKAAQPVTASTDADYIKVLQERFRVCSRLEKGMSLTQRLVQQVAKIREEMTLVDSLTSPLVLATTRAPRDISEALERANFAAKRLRRASTKVIGIQRTISWEPCKAHVVPQWFANGYKQRLVAFVKGKEIEICSNPKDGILGLSGDPSLGAPYGHFYGSPKTGKTFAELGIDLKADGKPRLKMYYRNESIEL